jgi:hypothetical protein
MDKNSTKNELLKLLYNEFTPSEAAELRQAMSHDEELSSEYEMLKEAKDTLPKVLFNPSDSAINRILAHSRQTQPVHS